MPIHQTGAHLHLVVSALLLDHVESCIKICPFYHRHDCVSYGRKSFMANVCPPRKIVDDLSPVDDDAAEGVPQQVPCQDNINYESRRIAATLIE